MPKFRHISGKKCVFILTKYFGFVIKRQKGSHVILIKETVDDKVGTVVPIHDVLKIGTLKSIIKLANIKESDFFRYL